MLIWHPCSRVIVGVILFIVIIIIPRLGLSTEVETAWEPLSSSTATETTSAKAGTTTAESASATTIHHTEQDLGVDASSHATHTTPTKHV
jgi:hypothetical protein